VIEVSLEPQLTENTRQIVSPPEAPAETIPNKEANKLSDSNVSVLKEQIRRGDDPSASPLPPTSQEERGSNPARETRSQTTEPKLKQSVAPKPKSPPPLQLKLNQDDFIDKLNSEEASSKSPKPLERQPLGNYEPFSRPTGSGARFLGSRGSNEFLPNLPDGDITLLNTKADKYAVFVRRVASQVFSQLRSSGWENLRASDIASSSDFATVIGVMDKSGTYLGATIESSSGSRRFDELLLEAVRKSVADRNPPPGAEAEDGRIYFIFRSKSWIRGAFNPRSGAPTERRWLLLGTGLR
jgi:TonB family protein